MHSLQEVIFFSGNIPQTEEGSTMAKSILGDSAFLAIDDRSRGRQVLKMSQSSSLSQKTEHYRMDITGTESW